MTFSSQPAPQIAAAAASLFGREQRLHAFVGDYYSELFRGTALASLRYAMTGRVGGSLIRADSPSSHSEDACQIGPRPLRGMLQDLDSPDQPDHNLGLSAQRLLHVGETPVQVCDFSSVEGIEGKVHRPGQSTADDFLRSVNRDQGFCLLAQ